MILSRVVQLDTEHSSLGLELLVQAFAHDPTLSWYLFGQRADFEFRRRAYLEAYLGSVDVSAEPQQGCSEGQHRLEMTGLFLKTRSNPPVMLQFAEQALHDVALFIKIPVA